MVFAPLEGVCNRTVFPMAALRVQEFGTEVSIVTIVPRLVGCSVFSRRRFSMLQRIHLTEAFCHSSFEFRGGHPNLPLPREDACSSAPSICKENSKIKAVDR